MLCLCVRVRECVVCCFFVLCIVVFVLFVVSVLIVLWIGDEDNVLDDVMKDEFGFC